MNRAGFSGELERECRQLGRSRLTTVACLLELGRWNVPERFEQAVDVVPRDPFEGRKLDVLEPLPRPAEPRAIPGRFKKHAEGGPGSIGINMRNRKEKARDAYTPRAVRNIGVC
jgi:hypothetical protein